jgi:hypothetical protein
MFKGPVVTRDMALTLLIVSHLTTHFDRLELLPCQFNGASYPITIRTCPAVTLLKDFRIFQRTKRRADTSLYGVT